MYQPSAELKVLQSLLDEVCDHTTPSPTVIETGDGLYGSTAAIADWCSRQNGLMGPDFFSVSMNAVSQQKNHRQLEIFKLAQFCTFRTQAPVKFLTELTWADFVLLHPENLQEGVEQFSLALSAGAGLIVIRDYQTAGAFAVARAAGIGWKVDYDHRYCILRRE